MEGFPSLSRKDDGIPRGDSSFFFSNSFRFNSLHNYKRELVPSVGRGMSGPPVTFTAR